MRLDKAMLKSREGGFNLLELIIVMAVLGVVMAMNNQLLVSLMTGQRQQASVVSSQFETALSLEIMRADLSHAGFGLADEFASTPGTYTEATSAPAQQFNDAPNVPRPLVHSNDVSSVSGYLANSDYLVIKSPAVGMNSAAGKWTHITGSTVHVWNDLSLDMENNKDYMIVIKPRTALGGKSKLIVSSGTYAIHYVTGTVDAAFQPTGTGVRYIAYGVDDTTLPTMPFNRADYFVKRDPANINQSCATGTGTLIKAIVKPGGSVTEYPLMECVANMQVVFRLDTNSDGVPDSTVNGISSLDSFTMKEQLKEVRVYILTHEGTRDNSYKQLGSSSITVGPDTVLGTSVNLSSLVGTDWNRYRWKVHTLFVKPKSFY